MDKCFITIALLKKYQCIIFPHISLLGELHGLHAFNVEKKYTSSDDDCG